ncbi:hypothetical protein SBA3_1680001 [Candidatus Sulfopaludibacter sp. SbA3]|nr:hypothetical protein SBA3_1680001 [Candidatus Sulfopaludibacter sp. SbA3]
METLGRNLQPSGSWATPFRRATFMSRPGLIWFAIWFGGIAASLLYSVF